MRLLTFFAMWIVVVIVVLSAIMSSMASQEEDGSLIAFKSVAIAGALGIAIVTDYHFTSVIRYYVKCRTDAVELE